MRLSLKFIQKFLNYVVANMKNLKHIYFFIFLIACESIYTQDTDNLEAIETISAMSASRAQAFNEGNAAEIAKFFTVDAYLMAPDLETQRGPEAIEAYYQSIFDQYETVLESGYENVVVDGDLAYGRGYAKVTLVDRKTGEKSYATSKYLNILERQNDGTWLTTHDIWNGNNKVIKL